MFMWPPSPPCYRTPAKLWAWGPYINPFCSSYLSGIHGDTSVQRSQQAGKEYPIGPKVVVVCVPDSEEGNKLCIDAHLLEGHPGTSLTYVFPWQRMDKALILKGMASSPKLATPSGYFQRCGPLL